MTKYEELVVLREVTKLDVISSLKVMKECLKAEERQNIMASLDPTHVYSVDYSSANELEYNLRMAALRKMLLEPWKKYISIENDGAGLEIFMERYLNEHYEKITNNSKSM